MIFAAVIIFAAAAVRTRVGVGLLPLQLRRRPDDEVRLREASRLVRRRLYVSLGSEVDWEAVSLDDACRRLQFVYEQTARWRPQLDVCVLLPVYASAHALVLWPHALWCCSTYCPPSSYSIRCDIFFGHSTYTRA